MGGVSPLDQYPGLVNVLMLKKSMETQQQAVAVITETLAKLGEKDGPVNPPHLGRTIDLRL